MYLYHLSVVVHNWSIIFSGNGIGVIVETHLTIASSFKGVHHAVILTVLTWFCFILALWEIVEVIIRLKACFNL